VKKRKNSGRKPKLRGKSAVSLKKNESKRKRRQQRQEKLQNLKSRRRTMKEKLERLRGRPRLLLCLRWRSLLSLEMGSRMKRRLVRRRSRKKKDQQKKRGKESSLREGLVHWFTE
jgi:hypothetical protein